MAIRAPSSRTISHYSVYDCSSCNHVYRCLHVFSSLPLFAYLFLHMFEIFCGLFVLLSFCVLYLCVQMFCSFSLFVACSCLQSGRYSRSSLIGADAASDATIAGTYILATHGTMAVAVESIDGYSNANYAPSCVRLDTMNAAILFLLSVISFSHICPRGKREIN